MRNRLRAASSATFGGAHVVFGGVERGLGLLHFLERDGLALVQSRRCRLSLICARLSVERALFNAVDAAMKSFCACTMSVGFDHEQRLADADDVAGLDEQLGDPAGIGREDRRRAIFVDGDLAFGHVLGAEHLLLDGFHRQRRPLGGGRIEQAPRPLRLARDCGVHVRRFAVGLRLDRPDDGGASDDERHERSAPACAPTGHAPGTWSDGGRWTRRFHPRTAPCRRSYEQH